MRFVGGDLGKGWTREESARHPGRMTICDPVLGPRFEAAIGDEKLPKDVRMLAPRLLWTAHMGMILYFLNDRSAGQKKTRALVDGGLDLLVQGFSMSSIPLLQPMVKPIRSKIINLLEEAELVPAEKE